MHVKQLGFGAGVDAAYAVVDSSDERFVGKGTGTVEIVRLGFGESLHPKERVLLGHSVLAEVAAHRQPRDFAAFEPLLERGGFTPLRQLRTLKMTPELVAELSISLIVIHNKKILIFRTPNSQPHYL